MKAENPHNLPLDEHEQLLDRQLQRALPVQPPPDLAERIFAATVHALRDQRGSVIGRIGARRHQQHDWTQWAGWRYAAAVGLFIFYAALWARPHVFTAPFTDIELARADQLIVEPQTHLDTSIDHVAAQIDALSHGLATSFTAASPTSNNNTLAQELYQLDTSQF